MELYSPIFGKVYLDKVRRYLAIVVTTDRKQGDSKEEFLYDGRYGMNGECMLFPSKGKTTWEGFVPPCSKFKDGDIVTSLNTSIYILTEHHGHFFAPCGLISDYKSENHRFKVGSISISVDNMRLATEEEKQKLFDAIKANGYRWNPETKKLEELPKFKVGDKIIYVPNKHMGASGSQCIISEITNEKYIFNDGNYLPIRCQDGWELVPNKFDINTLKPFDKVLVRNTNNGKWCGQFYMDYNKNEDYPFECTYNCWKYCIPYEGNEHLRGTTDECEEFYKL